MNKGVNEKLGIMGANQEWVRGVFQKHWDTFAEAYVA